MSTSNSLVASRRAAEIAFAAATALLGAVVIWGASEHDVGWTRSGPEAGYFPFRIGLVLLVVSIVILIGQWRQPSPGEFLRADTLRELARFALPLTVFVASVPWLGMYIAGAIYLALSTGWIGRTSLPVSLAIAALVPAVVYVVFEFIFLVPLPKGPLDLLIRLFQ